MAKKQYNIDFKIGAVITPEMRKSLSEAQRQLNSLENNAISIKNIAKGVAATVSFAKVFEFGKDSITDAMEFESNIADVKKVVDELNDETLLKSFKAEINEMASTTLPMTQEELLEIAASAGQAGIAFGDLAQFTEDAGKMGIALDVTAETAGEWMAQWRTAFKMNQEQVVGLADKINYLSNTSAASAPKIAGVVTSVGPLGDVAGVTSGDIAALATSMISVGVGEEIAATGIKNLMVNMTKGSSATKKQQQAFSKLGLSSTQLAKNMQKDAQGTIVDLLERIRKLPEYQQTSILQEIFGKESLGAIAPLLSNLDNLKEQFGKVGDATLYAGSMEKEFQSRSATTSNQIQLTKNSWETFKITVGEQALPLVSQASQFAAECIQKLTDKVPAIVAKIGEIKDGAGEMWAKFQETWPKIEPVVYGIVSALVAYKVALVLVAVAQKANMIIQTLISAWRTAATVISLIKSWSDLWTVAQWALNAALSANPIGIVVMLIGILVAAGVYMYKNWEWISVGLKSVWEAIKLMFALGANRIITLINGVISAINLIPGINIPLVPKIETDEMVNNIKNLNEEAKALKETMNSDTSSSMDVNSLLNSSDLGALSGDTTSRTENILGQTSNMGALDSINGLGSSSTNNINYSPNIVIEGRADEEIINKATENSLKEFETLYNKLENQKKRTAL